MNQETFYQLGVFLLLYFVATVILVNRIILYKSLRTSTLEESVLNGKVPYLISANLSLVVSLFVMFKSLMNLVTYKLPEYPEFLELLGWSSTIMIISLGSLVVSYILALFVMKMGVKMVNSIIFSILWFCFNSTIVILFDYIYTQISKSDAFTIF